jgi:transposase
MCRDTGDLSRQALTLNNLGDVFPAAGRQADARAKHAAALRVQIQTGEMRRAAKRVSHRRSIVDGPNGTESARGRCAAVLGLHRKTVYSWLARYREGGKDALKARPVPGRPPKLGGAQLSRLYALIAGQDPRQMQFEFGVSLSVVSCQRRAALAQARHVTAEAFAPRLPAEPRGRGPVEARGERPRTIHRASCRPPACPSLPPIAPPTPGCIFSAMTNPGTGGSSLTAKQRLTLGSGMRTGSLTGSLTGRVLSPGGIEYA